MTLDDALVFSFWHPNPVSMMHEFEHPSLLRLFPSSHYSRPALSLLPHTIEHSELYLPA
jgi:hypothetical protein